MSKAVCLEVSIRVFRGVVSIDMCLSVFVFVHRGAISYVCVHTSLCLVTLLGCIHRCPFVSICVQACVWLIVSACMRVHMHVDLCVYGYGGDTVQAAALPPSLCTVALTHPSPTVEV